MPAAAFTLSNWPPRLREAAIRGLIWAFVGLLYAFLFVSFAVFAETRDLPVNPYFFAGVLAGTIAALMYSSMRLVVLMAALLFPVSIIYFTQFEQDIVLVDWFKVMLPTGILIGAVYGYFSTNSRIRRADAKTLAGFSVGVLVSLSYLVAEYLLSDLSITLIVGLMCPLTGILYVLVVPTFIKLYQDILPPAGDGALLGACIAVFVSFCSFVMAGSIDSSMAGELVPEVQAILQRLPPAVTGGVVGAGLSGIVSGLLLRQWQDL
jgi:hypothetical protein